MKIRLPKSFATATLVAFTVLSFGGVYPTVTQSRSLPGMNQTLSLTNRAVNDATAHDDDDDDRGRIAFVRFNAGNNDIYVMNPDGTGLVNVTNHRASDRLPAWSFDGSKIAFRSTRDGNQEIYVMNDDGSDVVRLTFDPAVDTSPSWTPEGRILFSSNRRGRFEIYEVNADGSDLRHIDIAVEGNLTFPNESSEGHRLAFISTNFFDAQAIWIAHTDGTHPTQLTPNEMHAAFPDWSPTGNHLLFSNNVCPICDLSEIFVTNQSGNGMRQLTSSGDGNNDLFGRWSPDGSQIVFTRDDFVNPTTICVMNGDGSDVVNITHNAAFDFEPDWGPSKRRDDDEGLSRER